VNSRAGERCCCDRTHLWWSEEGPAVDLRAEDQELLERLRAKLLARAPALIVPGHGEPFAPGQPRASVR
jgi:glyoxylase-like metal-dependent hydrolase (beta-lactamase superfamily II)